MSIFSKKSKPKDDGKSKQQQDGSSQQPRQVPKQPGPQVPLTDAERTAQRMAIQAASRKRMNSSNAPDYSIKGLAYHQNPNHVANVTSQPSSHVRQPRRDSKGIEARNGSFADSGAPRQPQKIQKRDKGEKIRKNSSKTTLLEGAEVPDSKLDWDPIPRRDSSNTLTSQSVTRTETNYERDFEKSGHSYNTVQPESRTATALRITNTDSREIRQPAQERTFTGPQVTRDSGYGSVAPSSAANSRSPSETNPNQELETSPRPRKINASMPRASLSEEIANNPVSSPRVSKDGRGSEGPSISKSRQRDSIDSPNYTSRLDPGRVSMFLDDSVRLLQSTPKQSRSQETIQPMLREKERQDSQVSLKKPQQPASGRLDSSEHGDSPTLGDTAKMGNVVPPKQTQPTQQAQDRSGAPLQQISSNQSQRTRKTSIKNFSGPISVDSKSRDQAVESYARSSQTNENAYPSSARQFRDSAPQQARSTRDSTPQARSLESSAQPHTDVSEPTVGGAETPKTSTPPSVNGSARAVHAIAPAGTSYTPKKSVDTDARSATSKASASDSVRPPGSMPRLPSLPAMSQSSNTRNPYAATANDPPKQPFASSSTIQNSYVDNQVPIQSNYLLSPTEPHNPQLPSVSVLEGFKVNRRGQVLDEEGEPIGELVQGELLDCVRQRVNSRGEVVDEFGSVVGRVRILPRTVGPLTLEQQQQRDARTSSFKYDSLPIAPVARSEPRDLAPSQSVHKPNTHHLRVQEHLASRSDAVQRPTPPPLNTQQTSFIAELDGSVEAQASSTKPAPAMDTSEPFSPFPGIKAPESTESLRSNFAAPSVKASSVKTAPSTEPRPDSQSKPFEPRRDSESKQSEASLEITPIEQKPKKWTSKYFVGEGRSSPLTSSPSRENISSPVEERARAMSLLEGSDTSAALKAAVGPFPPPSTETKRDRSPSIVSNSGETVASLLPASHHQIATTTSTLLSPVGSVSSRNSYTGFNPASGGLKPPLNTRGSFHQPLKRSPLSSIAASPPDTGTPAEEKTLNQTLGSMQTVSKPRALFGHSRKLTTDSEDAAPPPIVRKAETQMAPAKPTKQPNKRKSIFGLPFGKKEHIVIAN